MDKQNLVGLSTDEVRDTIIEMTAETVMNNQDIELVQRHVRVMFELYCLVTKP